MKINFSANLSNKSILQQNHICSIFGKFFYNQNNFELADSFIRNQNVINQAIANLQELTFSQEDIKKVKKYGAQIIFETGQQAIEYAKEKNIHIVFDKVDQAGVHAQWVNDKNTIIINDKYKNTTDPAEIYAISAAILHEIAHSKDNDSISSIQEEIDCLAMNALAFNIYQKKYPHIFNNNNSPILQDGVMLYSKLFLGDNEQALFNRIKQKYGNLSESSPHHQAGKFAKKIAK